MAELPPPHPPIQARHPGRRNPSPHLKHHDHAMHRPNEHLHLAKHSLAGHHHHPKKPAAPEGGDGN